jgi:putative oxidoreductase
MKDALSAAGLLWLRVLMGVGIALHGYGKIFGGGMDGYAQMVGKLGFPAPTLFAWLSALAEFAGGILVALGLGTRVAAAFVFVNMTVAAFHAHSGDPLKVKELALAYWTIAGAIVLLGGGRLSLDCLFCKRCEREKK